MARVTDLCAGCRRCYRLCTSFDYMLDEAVDKNDGDVLKITSADYRKVVDLCWQCKLCYNHCPYTPPHKWDIDFPRLMLRAKAARAKAEGVSRQDAWLFPSSGRFVYLPARMRSASAKSASSSDLEKSGIVRKSRCARGFRSFIGWVGSKRGAAESTTSP